MIWRINYFTIMWFPPWGYRAPLEVESSYLEARPGREDSIQSCLRKHPNGHSWVWLTQR